MAELPPCPVCGSRNRFLGLGAIVCDACGGIEPVEDDQDEEG